MAHLIIFSIQFFLFSFKFFKVLLFPLLFLFQSYNFKLQLVNILAVQYYYLNYHITKSQRTKEQTLKMEKRSPRQPEGGSPNLSQLDSDNTVTDSEGSRMDYCRYDYRVTSAQVDDPSRSTSTDSGSDSASENLHVANLKRMMRQDQLPVTVQDSDSEQPERHLLAIHSNSDKSGSEQLCADNRIEYQDPLTGVSDMTVTQAVQERPRQPEGTSPSQSRSLPVPVRDKTEDIRTKKRCNDCMSSPQDGYVSSNSSSSDSDSGSEPVRVVKRMKYQEQLPGAAGSASTKNCNSNLTTGSSTNRKGNIATQLARAPGRVPGSFSSGASAGASASAFAGAFAGAVVANNPGALIALQPYMRLPPVAVELFTAGSAHYAAVSTAFIEYGFRFAKVVAASASF